MKASTYKEFRKINRSVKALKKSVDALVAADDQNQDAKLQKIADDLNAGAGALNTATGTPAK